MRCQSVIDECSMHAIIAVSIGQTIAKIANKAHRVLPRGMPVKQQHISLFATFQMTVGHGYEMECNTSILQDC